jgi:hypothetical protein
LTPSKELCLSKQTSINKQKKQNQHRNCAKCIFRLEVQMLTNKRIQEIQNGQTNKVSKTPIFLSPYDPKIEKVRKN